MKNIPTKYHPAVRKLIKKAREDERERALDLAMNYYINQNMETRMPIIVSKELYKKLLSGF